MLRHEEKRLVLLKTSAMEEQTTDFLSRKNSDQKTKIKTKTKIDDLVVEREREKKRKVVAC